MAFTTFLPVSFSFAKHRIGTLHNFVTQLGKVKHRNVVFFIFYKDKQQHEILFIDHNDGNTATVYIIFIYKKKTVEDGVQQHI